MYYYEWIKVVDAINVTVSYVVLDDLKPYTTYTVYVTAVIQTTSGMSEGLQSEIVTNRTLAGSK